MIWHRSDYLELMTFGRVERPMFTEIFGLLIGVDKEWQAQGATEDEISLKAFDFDFVKRVGCGGNTFAIGSQSTVIEETEEYRLLRDMFGRTLKLIKNSATIPLPLDFPVKTMDDWLRLKPMFQFRPERIDWNQVEKARAEQATGALVQASIPGGYDMARELMGEEVACTSYYEQPELMKDILDTLTDTALRTLGPISERIRIDQLYVHEDFAGKAGPLIGPNQIRNFLKPYYRATWDMVSARGTRLFEIDTDGNITTVIDALCECGINSFFPMEPAAGMDIVKVREKYQRGVAMRGGIDKFVLKQSKKDIRRELVHKLQPSMWKPGGIVFGLDHRIPNGTPLEHYRYYVDTAREILGLPPRTHG